MTRFDFYPGEDVPTKFDRKQKHNKTALKEGLKAGQVLILLSGRFRGKRVIFLRQLDSGLLLVTGPYKVNGVPLKRVNQAYTISTSTHVDIKGADFSKVNDATFAKEKADKATGESKFFAADQTAPKKQISSVRKDAQKSVDTALNATLKANALLRKYLASRFTLTKHSKPHAMIF